MVSHSFFAHYRTSVLEKASKAVWELILDNNNLGKEINETVEKVFMKLSGRETRFNEGSERKKSMDEKLTEDKSTKAPHAESVERDQTGDSSTRRKRSFSDMNSDSLGSMDSTPTNHKT